ncbi:MAG: hypothetical protein GY880_00005 [Planctomycetaceae bacterium]|nr:hypothetical protein [Planctomycetaceae bacterium]MCP4772596.1 hypothetical protein [Planctomycetaceae bacterium]
MNLQEFKTALSDKPAHELGIQFDSGIVLPPHFHITEIGKVTKDFVDCGGTRRTTISCVLQTFIATDFDHRLKTDKLSTIIEKASALELDESTPVEIEIQTDTIGTYAVTGCLVSDGKVTFEVAAKQTACLAPDQCGIDSVPTIEIATADPSVEECGDTGC